MSPPGAYFRHAILLNILILAYLLLFVGCASVPDRFVDTGSGNFVSKTDLLKFIENKRVIFVGEAHDNRKDHLVQFEVIRHLTQSRGDVTIALEMFPKGSQHMINAWLTGIISEADFQEEYSRTWNMPYENYEKIFRYAKSEGIPLVAVNAEPELIRNIAINGLGIMPGDILEKLMYRKCEDDPVYARVFGSAGRIESHEARLTFHCDAQRLRDSFMAFNISRLINSDIRTVVVLLGAAHASRIAVPRLFQEHSNITPAILLPASFLSITGQQADAEQADYIWY